MQVVNDRGLFYGILGEKDVVKLIKDLMPVLSVWADEEDTNYYIRKVRTRHDSNRFKLEISKDELIYPTFDYVSKPLYIIYITEDVFLSIQEDMVLDLKEFINYFNKYFGDNLWQKKEAH